MGTQQPYGGPSPEKNLLPDWALPEEPDTGDVDDDNQDSPDQDTPDEETPDTSTPHKQQQHEAAAWKAARGSMTRFVSGGGGRTSLRTAARNYVRARGGPRRAASTATSDRSAAAALGHFLSTVATRGIEAGLNAIGLKSLVGKDIEEVFAEIANALAPDAALRSHASARKAINEALYRTLEANLKRDEDIATLESMSGKDVADALRDCVTACIYSRWLEELGLSIERRAISATEAVRLEREVKQYVRECVRLETGDKDVLSINWRGPEGRGIITRIFEDAYSLLETRI